MATDKQIQDAVACFLSSLTRYYYRGDGKDSREIMIAETDVLVGFLLELSLGADETEMRILEPVETHLLTCYGHELGQRIYRNFVRAFERGGMALLARR